MLGPFWSLHDPQREVMRSYIVALHRLVYFCGGATSHPLVSDKSESSSLYRLPFSPQVTIVRSIRSDFASDQWLLSLLLST